MSGCQHVKEVCVIVCNQCGGMLSDGVKFCKHCGARQQNSGLSCKAMLNAANAFGNSGTGGALASKGLDPNRSYVMRFNGRFAELYSDVGQQIRVFNMRLNIVQATTTGETVTIVTEDGYTHLYRWDGTLLRTFR